MSLRKSKNAEESKDDMRTHHLHVTVHIESPEERGHRNLVANLERFYSQQFEFRKKLAADRRAARDKFFSDPTIHERPEEFWKAYQKSERERLGFWRYYFL